jgi:hypothetical protein
MIVYLRRRRFVIAVSLVSQAIFFVWLWHSPDTLPGSDLLWVAVFPGFVFAWAAAHTSMAWGLALMVIVSLAYHLVLEAVIGTSWRLMRRAV